jgi:microcystin-dependent protein
LGIKLGVGSNDTVLTADSTTSSGVAWKTPSAAIPSGSVILFYQSTAPTGWTQVTTQNNKALRVVSGTGGGTGGSTNFTSVFTSRTPSGSVSGGNVSISISGTTNNHSLTRAQLPNHRHGMNHSHYINDPGHRHQWGVDDNAGASGPNNPDANPGGNYRDTTYATTGVNIQELNNDVNNNRGVVYPAYENGTVVTGDASNQGLNGEGHSHGFSGSGSGSVSASFSGNEMDFAVQYIDVILCSKN